MTQHILTDKRPVPKYKYSPTETTLLKLLPANGRTINSTKLTERYYTKINQEPPFHAKIVVNSAMRSLMQKAEANREPFKILRAVGESPGGQGRPPYEYWRE